VTIDSSVTAIDDMAFAQSKSTYFPTYSRTFQNPSITVLTIPSSVLSIGASAFEDMATMTSITIANSVTTIGRDVFRQNNNVTELKIGTGASLIESDTYQEFRYVSKVEVPEGVTRIDGGAFSELYSVTSFTLPSTLVNLRWNSLRGMHSLRTINIPTNLSTIDDPFGYLWYAPLSVPYLCSTTGSSNTSSVNEYFATLIAYNTSAGRCANSFDAPTITSVTSASSTSATINFTPPSNFGAGSQISSYAVVAFPGGKRATVSGAAARSITIGSLNPETTYTFEVTAINNESPAITSPPSTRSASITCCTVSSAPGAPTIGTATALTPTSALISFTAPTSNGGATITSYTATSTPGSLTGTVSQAASGSITVNGLTASTSYTFRVIATNSVGSSSNSSASASITMPASQAEIAAAALAAQRAAEAKREAEKQSARSEIAKNYLELIIPRFELFSIAEISGVTVNNLPYISNEILAFAAAPRSEILNIVKISDKYRILDAICAGDRFTRIYAQDLTRVGLIPKENQTTITYALRSSPASDRDSYFKISSVINEQLAIIKIRKERLQRNRLKYK
jgi:hypothetical protein